MTTTDGVRRAFCRAVFTRNQRTGKHLMQLKVPAIQIQIVTAHLSRLSRPCEYASSDRTSLGLARKPTFDKKQHKPISTQQEQTIEREHNGST